jgi:general transcription factor 3C polypeptide 5 (transcription factor C subunit 1)
VGLPPFSWLKNEVPYFLPPAAFSRMDSVQQYTPKTEVLNSDTHYVIGKTRKRRAGFSNFISFNTPYVPTSPPKGIETAMKVKFLQKSHVEKMHKAFEDRPIWSKTALMYVTKYSNEQLKILLPSVAYYFMTGPWRITWVRLGYDPRKDPEAKKYQTLDYRLKAMRKHNFSTSFY